MKKYRFLIAAFALVFLGLLVYFVGHPLIGFMSDPEKFRIWVEGKGIWGVLIFMGMNIVQVILAVIPGGPFEIGAGYAFGIVRGTLICDTAMTLGSILTFLFARRFGIRFVELFVSKEKIDSVKILKNSKKRDGIVFLFFLLPGTPKDLISYLAGLTDMKLSTWVLINFVGRLPGILLSAMSGSAFSSKRYGAAAGLVIAIAVLYLIGSLVYRWHNAKHHEESA